MDGLERRLMRYCIDTQDLGAERSEVVGAEARVLETMKT
ncbi:hypothetical protein ENSA5_59940 [Enhygromyxa salina]|uniref:Uncharacterized protein n=1 Tax=Enhygromyxa salina TaxID=215803 RepID=A0A2S9XDI0_9BACT|nr:hypothetical protein ENSA5_59940 [Enhygromyxa salina]